MAEAGQAAGAQSVNATKRKCCLDCWIRTIINPNTLWCGMEAVFDQCRLIRPSPPDLRLVGASEALKKSIRMIRAWLPTLTDMYPPRIERAEQVSKRTSQLRLWQ
jgi:hypothetical protein